MLTLYLLYLFSTAVKKKVCSNRTHLSEFGDGNTDHFDDVGVSEVSEAGTSVGQEVVAAEDGDLVAVLQLQQVVSQDVVGFLKADQCRSLSKLLKRKPVRKRTESIFFKFVCSCSFHSLAKIDGRAGTYWKPFNPTNFFVSDSILPPNTREEKKYFDVAGIEPEPYA